MGLLDIFTAANPTAAVVQGTVKGVLGEVGNAADALYSYVTGNLPPEKAAEFNLKYSEFQQIVNSGQIQINLEELKSGKGGWRNALGWVCVFSLGAYYIPQPLIASVLWLIQCTSVMAASLDITKVTLPAYPTYMSMSEILGLVVTMLGAAGLKSIDLAAGTRK